MTRIKTILKRLIKILGITFIMFLVGSVLFFFFYANSLNNVHPDTIKQYKELQSRLVAKGFRTSTVVISAKRASWHNEILTAFGAAKNSQHLSGKAIDILVLDVNDDGKMNYQDVDLVVDLLESIIGEKGGIGTYKNETNFWDQQMVHFDARGSRARWNR